MTNGTTAPKTAVPTERQRAVLDALKGGRTIRVDETNGKKKLAVLGPSGKPVKEQPKLDRGALESCQKKGWVSSSRHQQPAGGDSTTFSITEDGTKAKRRK